MLPNEVKFNSEALYMNRFPSTVRSIIEEVDSASDGRSGRRNTPKKTRKHPRREHMRMCTSTWLKDATHRVQQGLRKEYILWRRAKSFRFVDGILQYKGKERDLKQVMHAVTDDSEQMLLSIEAQLCTRKECTFVLNLWAQQECVCILLLVTDEMI